MNNHLDITIEYLDGLTTEAKSEARIDIRPEHLHNLKIVDLCYGMLQSVIGAVNKSRADEFQEVCDEASRYRQAIGVAMEQLRNNNTDAAFATLLEADEA